METRTEEKAERSEARKGGGAPGRGRPSMGRPKGNPNWGTRLRRVIWSWWIWVLAAAAAASWKHWTAFFILLTVWRAGYRWQQAKRWSAKEPEYERKKTARAPGGARPSGPGLGSGV